MGLAARKNKFAIFSILRIVTPIEVAIMTKVSTGVKRVSLTGLIEGTESYDDPLEDKKVVSIEQIKKDKLAKESGIDHELPKEQSLPETQTTEQLKTGDEQIQNTPDPIQADVENLELTKEEKALRAAGVESKKEALAKKQAQEQKENREKQSTSVFILSEKEKLKNGQDKLRKIEIIQSYNKAANEIIDTKHDEQEEQDLSKSSNLGIIINKRQY